MSIEGDFADMCADQVLILLDFWIEISENVIICTVKETESAFQYKFDRLMISINVLIGLMNHSYFLLKLLYVR